MAATVSVAAAPDGTTAVTLIPTTGPQDAATTDLVHRIRNDVIPASGLEAHVGGQTALDVDFADLMGSRLPWFMAAVLAASFLLLMVEFRSLLVPLKAVIMNLLSIGAAYGVLVAIFQWGWFGLGHPGPHRTVGPHDAVRHRVRPVDGLRGVPAHRRQGAVRPHRQPVTSVADGLAGTARVITAAAAIMVCVFGSFVVSDMRPLRLFGLGTAAAVLIDATIVRLVLVPATMELLGRHNWWAPRWLRRTLDVLPGHHADPVVIADASPTISPASTPTPSSKVGARV